MEPRHLQKDIVTDTKNENRLKERSGRIVWTS